MNKQQPEQQRPPRRDEIRDHTVEVLVQGASNKADLLVVDVGQGPVVVKDFASKPWWTRVLGRLQIHREVRAYRWLAGDPAVPRFLGRIDPYALAMEKVEGRQLAFAPERRSDGPACIRGLRAAIDGIHRAGVVHMDLRGRENVLVLANGGIVLVDLAGAFCLRPGGLLHHLVFRWLTFPDETAFLKWKRNLTPEDLTQAELAMESRSQRYRSLWPFNRKPRPKEGQQ
ncbi:MAG: hypothetical protein IFK94_03440 [Acidobacteria bacterium]|uniref:Protein kinase domain-containing protein n=1 Tax=Candidatus Polarisedimenticola svalbardensis TaxID=2886004 RepID=A0A8J7C277_9BACT|nr:hypothetical protein [Candidatus Polarisedimenticola svalbardensis]